MLKQSTYFLASIIVLSGLLVIVERTSSPFFQTCIGDQQDTETNASPKDKPPGYDAVFTSYVACTGRFIEGHGVGITALATIVIAAFTATLWMATSGMTQTAGESVRIAERALADIERPYIYIFNPSGFKLETNIEDPFFYFQYSVANYGKTPASIESAFVGISAGITPKRPRAVIGWDEFLVSPLFVSGERRDSPTASIPDEIEIVETADEYGQYNMPVLTGESALFLWVIVKYSGPFSKGHETSACWRWEETSRRLVLHKEHNYQT
jgi:hypothetical protein